jgi:tRNA (guanine-N7-)-methyltransferase
VDNPLRTAEYLARRDTCLAELTASLHEILRGKTQVTFEIGCGHGHYLTGYATAHPQSFCLGIDLLKDRIARATRKRDRAGLPNLVFLQAEATDVLTTLPASTRLSDIFILFPDPWPKRRHHKNRILQPEFLTTLAQKTSPSARLFFRTDYALYFEDAHATLAAHPDWTLADCAEAWPFELKTVFQSRAAAFQSLIAYRSTVTPGAAQGVSHAAF